MCTCCVNAQEQSRPHHLHHPYKPLNHWPNPRHLHINSYKPSPTSSSSSYHRRMRQDGCRNRARAGKLPKMNNSERGKYYRQKSKEYEDGLEDAAVVMEKQIRNLEFFLRMRDELARQNATQGRSGKMVARVLQVVMQARSSGELLSSSARRSADALSVPFGRYEVSAPASNSARDALRAPTSTSLRGRLAARHTSLQLELGAFNISGSNGKDSGSPVIITLQGVLHTTFTIQTLASLYPHVMSDVEFVGRLADQHMSYPTSFRRSR